MRIEINTKPARKKQEGIDYRHLSCKKHLLAPPKTDQDRTKIPRIGSNLRPERFAREAGILSNN